MENSDKSKLFLSVIESNKGIIYKVANAYCKDKDDRKDLVQEIILKLWHAFETYNNAFKHTTWIYRIALNTAISKYRKEKIKAKYFVPVSTSFIELEDQPPAIDSERRLSLLQQFIAELKELDKALMLLYLEEKSHKEIAEIIGISESNVGTKINRIKNLLKEKFNKTTN